MSRTNRPILATLAALSLTFAAGSTQAQPVNYCEGRLNGQSLWSTQTTDNITTTTYYITLVNNTNNFVSFQIRFDSPNARVTSLQTGGVDRFVGSRNSIRLDLARETGTTSFSVGVSGNGLSRYVQLTCQPPAPPPRPRPPY
jgi:hypothetical protein